MTQPNDASKKSPRSFQCRDQLWETFEQMARELECSIDYLINEAMKQYARQRSYGAGAGSRTPFPGSRDSGPTDVGRPMMQQQPPPHAMPPPPTAPAVPMARSGGTAPMTSSQAQASRLPPPPPPPPSGGRAPLPPPPTGGRHPGMTGGPPPPPMGRPGGPPPIPRGPGSMPPSMGSVTPPHNPGMGMGGPPPLGGPMSHGGHGMGGHPLPPPPPQQQMAPQQQMPPPMAQPPSLQSMNAGAYLGGLTAIYQGERTSVNKEKFIIGRGRQASDLTIKDPNVSRQHAMIEFQNGVFYMVDLGSTNGVEYHGQRVTRKAIAEGDVFRICDHEVLFTFR